VFLQISLWMNHLWIYHLENFDANNIHGLVSFLKNLIYNHNIRNILIDKGHVHHEKKTNLKKNPIPMQAWSSRGDSLFFGSYLVNVSSSLDSSSCILLWKVEFVLLLRVPLNILHLMSYLLLSWKFQGFLSILWFSLLLILL